jgi:hypothetical protein
VDVHFALLNTSRDRIYFHRLSGPSMTLAVFDETGARVAATSYSLALEGVTSQAFEIVDPDEILIGSLDTLAGCDGDELAAFESARRRAEQEYREGSGHYGRILFERDLFINWGDSCIRLAKPGTYNLVVEARNDFVVVTSGKTQIRTAVGTIKSPPLAITIVK